MAFNLPFAFGDPLRTKDDARLLPQVDATAVRIGSMTAGTAAPTNTAATPLLGDLESPTEFRICQGAGENLFVFYTFTDGGTPISVVAVEVRLFQVV
jgi:hypothetical protein